MALDTTQLQKLQEIAASLMKKTTEESEFLDFFRDREHSPSCSPTQVIHDPRQIIKPEQLKAGKEYERRHSHCKDKGLFKVIETPEEGDRKVLVTTPYDTGECKKVSLVDMGILPQQNGFWNSTNYVVPADKE